jgi:RNA recognition motif-containing protein
MVNLKQNGFAFVHFRKAEAAAKVLQELDRRKFKDQIVFGKRANKKSIRKRERASASKQSSNKRNKSDKEQEPEERVVSVAPKDNKRGKDAVWLSSDEEDLF